jgi:hypothetical protein
LKETVKEVRKEMTDWKKVFANSIGDKGLVSRKYKEF